VKRITLTAPSAGFGLALLAAPMAIAQQSHEWHHGDHFNGHRDVVTDWNRYHVRRPPSGYEWVHDGNQLVIIAIGTGLVASAFAHGY
jgi:Ni/Co efflux regulator RcnB